MFVSVYKYGDTFFSVCAFSQLDVKLGRTILMHPVLFYLAILLFWNEMLSVFGDKT